MIYVIVTNASTVVVGKTTYSGNSSAGLAADQARFPSLTFTTVDATTFNGTTFVGPNYALN